jgi:hypothetical protein
MCLTSRRTSSPSASRARLPPGWHSPVHGVTAGDPFRLTALMKQARIETLAGSQMCRTRSGTVAMEWTANRVPVAEAGPEVIQSVSTDVALDASKSL